MSYQYPYIEHYSPSPATSTPQAFAQWDIQDDPSSTSALSNALSPAVVQQHQNQHQQVQQQQLPQSDSDHATPASTASTPVYEAPPVIQLTERVPRRVRIQNPPVSTTQAASKSPLTPLRTIQQQPATPQSLPPASGKWYDMRDGKSEKQKQHPAPSDAQGGAPVRQTPASRAQSRLSGHPYQRRSVSGEGKTRRDSENSGQGLLGAAQIVMACGASPTRKDSDNSPSPGTNDSPTASPTQDGPHNTKDAPPRRMLIRTDVHQSSETNMLTAMLELPGVKKADLRLSLGVCPFSRVKQMTVTGKAGIKFSEEGYLVRERKYGEFKRVLVVPPETKPENIETSMEDGILYIRYPGIAPNATAQEEPSIIPLK